MLDYIRTSIEILMQMKLDEEKLAAVTGAPKQTLKKDMSKGSNNFIDANNAS